MFFKETLRSVVICQSDFKIQHGKCEKFMTYICRDRTLFDPESSAELKKKRYNRYVILSKLVLNLPYNKYKVLVSDKMVMKPSIKL
jgi:hypothetical protein